VGFILPPPVSTTSFIFPLMCPSHWQMFILPTATSHYWDKDSLGG
jgi:hypothetical protein